MTQNNLIEILTLVKSANADALAGLIRECLGDEEKKNFIKSLVKIKAKIIPNNKKKTGRITKSRLQGM